MASGNTLTGLVKGGRAAANHKATPWSVAGLMTIAAAVFGLQSRDVAVHAEPSAEQVKKIVETAIEPIQSRLTAVEYKQDKAVTEAVNLGSSVKSVADDVTEMRDAFVGNDLKGQKGVLPRLRTIEEKQDAAAKQISQIEWQLARANLPGR